MMTAKRQECKTGNETEPGRAHVLYQGLVVFFVCKEMNSKYCRLCTVVVFVAITQLGNSAMEEWLYLAYKNRQENKKQAVGESGSWA